MVKGWIGAGVAWLAIAGNGWAQEKAMTGNWKTPTGSLVQVYGCGDAVCLKIVQLEKGTPGTEDFNNPDPKLRSRALCGLQIGAGFHPGEGGKRAEGGTIYDPRSGKTYSGALAVDGDLLKLRGYLGVKLFGRSEEWNRVSGPVGACR